jgi:hypothetical protein
MKLSVPRTLILSSAQNDTWDWGDASRACVLCSGPASGKLDGLHGIGNDGQVQQRWEHLRPNYLWPSRWGEIPKILPETLFLLLLYILVIVNVGMTGKKEI